MLAAPMARLQQKKQAAVTTGKAEAIRHSLRDGLAAYTRSPRSAGLVSLRRLLARHQRLDTSVGVPGPRDFAVCMDLRSSDAVHTSIAPRLTFRDDWP